MAKDDVLQSAFLKAIDKLPLTLEETKRLHDATGVELLEIGTLAEASFARAWSRGEVYRWRAQLQQMPSSKRKDEKLEYVKGWFPFYNP